MSDKTTKIVPIIEEQQELSTNQISIEDSKSQVITALSMLDNIYKENITAYAQKLHECTYKIEQINNQIEPLYKELEPHKKSLEKIEKDIEYGVRTLEKLTEKWCQKSMVIDEIDDELNNLKHNSNEREQILKHRNIALKEIDFEIEETELLLLKNELEKQNILLLIEPIEQNIVELKHAIKEQEAKKRYIESSQLHNLSANSNQETNKALPQ